MSNQTSMGPTKVCVHVSAVIGLSLALTALAEPPAGDGERQRAAGRHLPISIEQAQSRALAKFTEADSDSDGQLTPEEFDSAKFPKRRGHRLHHHQEHDGPVTDAMPVDGDRHAAFEAELFDELDQDGDGAL